jgi:drug/metabolite transporter (DMT)-like permease
MNNIINKEHRLAGQGAILLCAILWSTSGLFIRLIDCHPMVIAGSRSFFAALFLLSLRLFFPFRKIAANSKTLILKTLIKDAPALGACGLGYAATMILFVIANKLTASANAIMLQYAAPVWAALLGWVFLRERPRPEHWAAMVLVGLGMFLVFQGGFASGSFLGDILALVSGITFGANPVILRAREDKNPADIMLFSHITCAVISIPFFFLFPPAPEARFFLSVIYMGIFQLGMASALFAYGIRRIPAVQAMLTATVEPVLNPVWVLLALGEKPALSAIIGGGIIISAIIFSSIFSNVNKFRKS